MLFNRSVRDNIALADPAMPMERVIEASFGYGTVFPSYSTHQVPSASKAATRGNVRQWELRAPQKQRAPTKAPLHQQLMGNHAERIEKCATKNVDRKIASVRKVANVHRAAKLLIDHFSHQTTCRFKGAHAIDNGVRAQIVNVDHSWLEMTRAHSLSVQPEVVARTFA
jgi:hypothetical protein